VGAQSGMVLPASGWIWTTDLALGRVVRVNPTTNAVVRRIPFASRPFGLAYGAGSVWVTDRSLNTLGRINPRTNRVIKKIKIGFSSYGVAFGAGSVWVTSETDGTVRRVARRRTKSRRRSRRHDTNGVVCTFGSLWIAARPRHARSHQREDQQGHEADRIARPTGSHRRRRALDLDERGNVARVDPATGRSSRRFPSALTARL
jgi:hypothetical protein